MDIVKLLAGFELFKDLGEAQLQAIANTTVEEKFSENQEIFHEHSTASDIYILTEGRVQIVGQLGKTDSATIHMIVPGKLFGEFAFIDGEPRSATAIANKESTVLKIQRDALYAAFEADSLLGFIVMRNLARILARRIRQTGHELRSSLMWEKN